ncbi:MAG: hypothetical protein AB1696_01545 [Planctomycetota bacterium]
MMRRCIMVIGLIGAIFTQAVLADAIIENDRVKLVLGDNAAWKSVVDKRTGKEWCYAGSPVPVADGRFNEQGDQAAAASMDGKLLTIKFAKNNTQLVYEVEPVADWIVFRIQSVSGPRPERLTMLRVPVTLTETIGQRLGIARDKDLAICLMAANMQATGAARAQKGYADLTATTQDFPGPKIEGAACALILCPMAEVKPLLQKAAEAFGLPTNTKDGVPVKDLPITKGSYWFMSFGEKDVDKVIDYCNRTGIKQVMLSFGAWSTAAGHYPINLANFPNGRESLKAMIDKLHANGILVGAHTFASKVKKTDPYVTPVPDKRFWKDMQCTLAGDVTAEQTEIHAKESLDQWPGSPACKQKAWEGGVKKHQEVILGDEIVQYETIGPEGKFDTFLGCKRGAWKTQAAAHKAGDTGYHFGVDGCIDGYIIDQETDLIDEVTSNLAEVFNYCGFDMVYFDGGEDVDRRRFDYYITKNQAMTMSKFTKRPILHLGTCMTHRLWHSFAHSATVDHYMNTLGGYMSSYGGATDYRRVVEEVDGRMKRTLIFTVQGKEVKWVTVKEHIDKSIKYCMRMEESLMPGELGWFGIWPKNKYSDGLQLDEAEYLMVKALAYNQPLSLQASFRNMEEHPLTPQILEIVKIYEDLRLGGKVDEATREKIKEMGRDFILLQGQDRRQFVEVHEMPSVAGTQDVRSFVGDLNGGSVATVWHYVKDGKLTLEVDPKRVTAITFLGEPVELAKAEGKVTIPVTNWRTTLVFDGIPAKEVRAILDKGTFEGRQAAKLWIQGETPKTIQGRMLKGADAGIAEPDAVGDVIVCAVAPGGKDLGNAYCEYTVDLPREGLWTIWARLRYTRPADESFWLVPQGGGEEAAKPIVLGNCGQNEAKWHWTGRGGGFADAPPGSPIALKLPKGPFTFRIYGREGGAVAQDNPRLDCLCVCDDPDYRPTDEEAKAALK